MYDCSKCPGYCCSYPLIALKKRDVERLAKYFGISFKEAKKKYTVERDDEKYAMRRKKDEIYGRICRFFDQEKRCCSIYKARPAICREYPGEKKCGYYDFLKFEREAQEDPDYISITWHK